MYQRPANVFVAGFIGSPAMNFLRGILRRDEDGYYLDAEPLVACLRRGGWVERVQLTSFAWHHLLAVRALEPSLTVGYLTPYLSLPLLERMARRGFHQVCPPAALVTLQWVEAAHSLGLRVRAYDVDSPEAARRVVASGADGMTVDDPLWGLSALAEAGGASASPNGWAAAARAVQLRHRRNGW